MEAKKTVKTIVPESVSPALTREGDTLIFTYDSEQLWLEPWGKNGLRVRATKMDAMPLQDWEMKNPGTSDPKIVFYEDGSADITNGKLTAKVSKFGLVTYCNQKDTVILKEFTRTRKMDSSASALEVDAREFKAHLGGDYQLTARFESLDPNERIYGMGQYQQPFLDLKGTDLELAHRNSQASVPFMLSSLGYGFLWNNPAIGRATFGKNVTTWEAKSTKLMDYWVTAGDTPAEIEEDFASVVGTVPMMPDYGMGFWQCKLRYRTQEELLEVARGYKKRGVPVSVIVADFFHWPRQGEWKFDTRYWPDPDAMVKELHEMGMELMVSIWPTVDYRSENFEEMMQKGYLIRTDRGARIGMLCRGDQLFFDATNPGAREYVWGKAKKNYYDKGIKVFWLDEAEPEYSVYDYDNYRYHMGPNVQIGNIFPTMYSKAFYDGQTAEGQKNIINLVRCAWVGSQKYGALVWSGDINSDFATFRNQYAAGLNMGLAGIPWWNTDIGGFENGNINDPAFKELLVRWFQYGTFCPVMRLHGNRKPSMPSLPAVDGEVPCGAGAPNEIWTYGPELEEIFKKYITIRNKMKPYITEVMQEAHEKGSPVMRTTFYEFPEDAECWNDHQEYLFGANVLVAPVMYEGLTRREVYLPRGAKWTNLWTGECFEGGQTIMVDAPLEQIPLFTRDDFVLPVLD